MPTIAPRQRSNNFAPPESIALLLTSSAQSRLFASALDVAEHLDRLKCDALPDRPEILVYDDGQIVEGYHKVTRLGKKAGPTVYEQLRIFTAWRTAVERAELTRGSNLYLVLNSIATLEAQEEHYGQIRTLRDWVVTTFNVYPPDPVPQNYKAREQFAFRFSQDRELFPIWLRLMTTPPPGKATHGSIDDEPEAD